jgi:transcriptional regulator with XRE-family HTH domain
MSGNDRAQSTPQPLDIYLRAYVSSTSAGGTSKRRKRQAGPSKFTLVFDTETTTDHAQRLRFGGFQLREGAEIHTAGIFYDPSALSEADQNLICAYAAENSLDCMSTASFADDVFYGMAFELRAAIVGFNLPFDLSRLAIGHGLARGSMKDGFSFQLSADRWKPRVQVKHLSSRAAFIQFAGVKRNFDNRRMRKAGERTVRRGSFIDLKTIAAALTSRSFSLGSLAEFLGLAARKLDPDQHGQALSRDYLRYAMQDVQVTWEAFVALKARFDEHDLESTQLSQILSEAGLGKAYLKEMGVRPWRSVQPDFPDEITGAILSTYFGGRAEVHIRRAPTRVLYCDFLSMYPTVCTLMRLWQFVIGKGLRQRDSTAETAAWLESVTPQDLQRPENWRRLTTIVRIKPNGDVLPVRARYEPPSVSSAAGKSTTIGLNHLSYNGQLWFTLADCLASKFLSGKAPQVVRAITFEPGEPQSELKTVRIAGKDGPSIDPYSGDAYRQLIDYRSQTKARMDAADGSERDRLDAEQYALKILANSTSYGIFIEVNVENLDRKLRRDCHFGGEQSFPIGTAIAEKPGTYFHPLLGTLITGAARLMLALAERAILDSGLDWAFCDTDSMAIAKPLAMPEAEFLSRARAVCDWFLPLNPYEQKGALLKVENLNFRIGSREIAPLYCLAISAKRYVLFNLTDEGVPVIRKASAHGLGHLLDPYDERDGPSSIPSPSVPLTEIGIRRWQYDLWFQIVKAAYTDKPAVVPLDYHPRLKSPAISRYAATTPDLLRWFAHFNAARPYAEQVKPFGFMCALQAKPPILRSAQYDAAAPCGGGGPIRPIAPYSRDAMQAATHCFDRETGRPIGRQMLQSYAEALRSYHLSPELKFDNGDAFDQGATQRRHVGAVGIHCIGKEANKWEEKSVLGVDDELSIEYGISPEMEAALSELMEQAMASDRRMAEASGLSRTTVRRIERGENVRPHTVAKAIAGLRKREAELSEISKLRELARIEIADIGLTRLARRLNCDPSNLSKSIAARRNMSKQLKGQLVSYFSQ